MLILFRWEQQRALQKHTEWEWFREGHYKIFIYCFLSGKNRNTTSEIKKRQTNLIWKQNKVTKHNILYTSLFLLSQKGRLVYCLQCIVCHMKVLHAAVILQTEVLLKTTDFCNLGLHVYQKRETFNSADLWARALGVFCMLSYVAWETRSM